MGDVGVGRYGLGAVIYGGRWVGTYGGRWG